MLRWVWAGRVVLSCAILVAAVFVWNRAEPNDTLIATLIFAVATLTTVVSAMYGEIEQRPYGPVFYGIQCAVDLGLVTAIVHITGGWNSQFAALYILVIASGALLLPFRGGLAVAAAACALYATDVLWLRPGVAPIGIAVQVGVFMVVAIGSGLVSLRLRQAGVGRDELAAQLVKVQLEAADILRTIRSGILTVDAKGNLLYANPAATDLLGVNLRSYTGRPVLEALRNVSPHLARALEQSSQDGIRTTRAEGRIRRADGEVEIGVTTTVTDAADGGERHSATAIFQDISDSKRLQALHVRAERLEAVAELSASLAHEIRNPLASIRSATEQLARRRDLEALPVDDDERILHGLVVREADRLSRLLGDFLDFARARVSRVVTPRWRRRTPIAGTASTSPWSSMRTRPRLKVTKICCIAPYSIWSSTPCRPSGQRDMSRCECSRRRPMPIDCPMVRTWRSVCQMMAAASPRMSAIACLNRSCRENPAAPALDCRLSIAPWRRIAASCSSTRSAREPASPSCFRRRRSPRLPIPELPRDCSRVRQRHRTTRARRR
jgi:PAS domain S-box-containing protein